MDLGKINRNAEDRSVVWAAVVTALMGTLALLAAGARHLDGDVPGAGASLLVALVLFGLAYGVYRGSRAAAVAVVGLYVLQAALTFLAYGPMGASPAWTVILGAMLWAGMRGVFAQQARPAAPPATARRPG